MSKAAVNPLVKALQAVAHQLTHGEASEGDRRDIAWCAKTANEAIAAHEEKGVAGTAESLLAEFCQAIDDTGGLVPDEGNADSEPSGLCLAPAASPDWVDLADIYEKACVLLGRTPVIEKSDEDEEEAGDQDD